MLFLVFSFVSIKVLAKYLGVFGNGELTTIITFTGFFTVLADLGLSTVATREISKKPEMMDKIIANSMAIRIYTALITAALCIGIGFLMPYSLNIKIGLITATAALLITFVGNIVDVVFQTKLKMQYTVLSDIAGRFTSLIIVILAWKYDLGFQFVVLNILVAAIFSILTKFYYARRFVKIRLEYDYKLWKWLLITAIPLGLVFVINNLYFKVDTLILSLLKDSSQVGLYGVSYKVLETTLFVGVFLSNAVVPILSKDIIDNRPRASMLIKTSLEALIALAMPIVAFILIAPDRIIRFLATQEFVQAQNALRWLALAIGLIYINVMLGQILIAADRRKILVWTSIGILLFNIAINLLLIPHFSYFGAAFTTFLSELVIFGYSLYFSQKSIRFSVNWFRIFKILISAGIMSVVFYITSRLNLHIIIIGLTGLLAYCLSAYVLRVADRDLVLSLISNRDENPSHL